jgi:hypothetical protein
MNLLQDPGVDFEFVIHHMSTIRSLGLLGK